MRILYVTRHFNHSGFLILQALIRNKFLISAVLLHEARAAWRNPFWRPFLKVIYRLKCWYYRCEPLKTIASEELLARGARIPVVYTNSIKSDSFFDELKRINPDIIVLGGGWHELIPHRVYSFPRLGCLNTHPSRLPEFRGTSITRWQILHGVGKSGSTIHYVDDNFDTGGVLAQKEVEVGRDLTPQELFYKLGLAGAEIMIPLLREFELGRKLEPFYIEHDHAYYNYYRRWEWNSDRLAIDWSMDFRSIHFFVLSNIQESYQYLGPWFSLGGKKWILRRTRLHDFENQTIIHSEPYFDADEIRCVAIRSGSLFLYRKGEKYILELAQVQPGGGTYFLRRAGKPLNRLKLKMGEKVNFAIH